MTATEPGTGEPHSDRAGEIVLTKKASQLAHRGQPWFFADDLARVAPPRQARLATVRDERGASLGFGFYSPDSRLALRLCGERFELLESDSSGGMAIGERFFARMLDAALLRRAELSDRRAEDGACRLVHGDADGLPGLVVDRYADCLVLQSTSAVIEESLDCIVPVLVDRLQPAMILARNDVPARKREKLPTEVRMLHGRRTERVRIVEAGIEHEVELFTGHKTGFYLDQRPARALVRQRANGLRVLDTFSYQGGFALAALAGGAREVVAIDQSAEALARAEAAARRNELHGLTTTKANVFDEMRRLREQEERFDLIVVDPPAFAKQRREVRGALRGYRDLNRYALRLLSPGGTLVTCTCSHHVDQVTFESVLRQAAAELPFRVTIEQRLGAGLDHPVWLSLPESEYLKVVVLRVGS